MAEFCPHIPLVCALRNLGLSRIDRTQKFTDDDPENILECRLVSPTAGPEN